MRISQLLKLDSPVQFGNNGNNNIQPICLTRSGGYEGTTVTVAGMQRAQSFKSLYYKGLIEL